MCKALRVVFTTALGMFPFLAQAQDYQIEYSEKGGIPEEVCVNQECVKVFEGSPYAGWSAEDLATHMVLRSAARDSNTKQDNIISSIESTNKKLDQLSEKIDTLSTEMRQEQIEFLGELRREIIATIAVLRTESARDEEAYAELLERLKDDLEKMLPPPEQ
jgi:hypothetical protein